MATLQGLSSGLRCEHGPLRAEDEKKEEAKARFVELKKEDDGWRFPLREYEEL